MRENYRQSQEISELMGSEHGCSQGQCTVPFQKRLIFKRYCCKVTQKNKAKKIACRITTEIVCNLFVDFIVVVAAAVTATVSYLPVCLSGLQI